MPPRESEPNIAARLQPTLADEDATDTTPGIDPSRPQVAAAPSAPAAPPASPVTATGGWIWPWAVAAAAILVVAAASRGLLRGGGSDPTAR
jgi:hypothetical protein